MQHHNSENKYALITGASGGIGQAIANKLLSEQYNLILVSRSLEKLNHIKITLQNDHPNNIILIEKCDVSNLADIDKFFIKIVESSLEIKTLINCAGISGGGITKNITPEMWSNVININLNGTFFVIQTLLKHNLMQKGGRIINIASTGGKQGVIHGAPYCASKHGLIGLTKSLGLELARNGSGITVNAICPGFVETDMAEQVRNHYAKIWGTDINKTKKLIEDRVPIGRYVEPAEVAAMASYLASEAASAITAQAINICGGLGNY